MPQSTLEMAKELVMAQIQLGQLPVEQVQDAIRQTHASLAALKAQEEMGTTAVASTIETPPVDWRKSITKHAVTCLECGYALKQLSVRHLVLHGLDGRSYRMKYGIPLTQSLAAKATTARRRQVAQETRPWEQAPAFLNRQARNGHAAPEPRVEAVRDEIEMPATAASAPAKRQRKTTPKKKPHGRRARKDNSTVDEQAS
jgi:predicted transcriptional regulator